MSERRELLERIRRLGAGGGDAIDVGEAALLLAALDVPGADLDAYREFLGALAREVGEAAAATVEARRAALAQVMYRRHGFRGDAETYDDPDNANLMRVIDRRKGLPVALGIILMQAARAQGWEIAGLAFPSHFLLRLQAGGDAIVVDPFDQGRPMGADDLRRRFQQMFGAAAEPGPLHLAPVGDRDVLLRLQNNIKVRALKSGRPERAIDVLESMAAVAPGDASVRLELANLHAGQGAVRAAIQVLDDFPGGGGGQGPGAIRELRESLKRRLN